MVGKVSPVLQILSLTVNCYCFIFHSPDTRPGLVPKHIARKHQIEKKEREANQKNKQKPKAVLEKEKRDEGLGAAITSENKGFSLLAKMGYKPGMAIGKKGMFTIFLVGVLQLFCIGLVDFML